MAIFQRIFFCPSIVIIIIENMSKWIGVFFEVNKMCMWSGRSDSAVQYSCWKVMRRKAGHQKILPANCHEYTSQASELWTLKLENEADSF